MVSTHNPVTPVTFTDNLMAHFPHGFTPESTDVTTHAPHATTVSLLPLSPSVEAIVRFGHPVAPFPFLAFPFPRTIRFSLRPIGSITFTPLTFCYQYLCMKCFFCLPYAPENMCTT